jgi:GR25 family glycosyltransferase involved in LPS biosynthesis
MKAFVIGLSAKEKSYMSAMNIVEQLKDYGHDAEFFDGVPGDQAVIQANEESRQPYPYSIKSASLDAEGLKEWIKPDLYDQFLEQHFWKIIQRRLLTEPYLGKVKMPGVIGCFYSHLALWRKCVKLDQPIMIFEDDIVLYRNYEPVEWKDVLILGLGKTTYLEDPYKQYLENPTGIPKAVLYKNSSMPGTCGYAITPQAASKLIKIYRGYYCPSDNAIHQFVCEIECHNYIMGRHRSEEEGNQSYTRTKEWQCE